MTLIVYRQNCSRPGWIFRYFFPAPLELHELSQPPTWLQNWELLSGGTGVPCSETWEDGIYARMIIVADRSAPHAFLRINLSSPPPPFIDLLF